MTLIIVVDAVEFDIYAVALREQIFDLRDAHVHALCLRAVAFLRRNCDFCDVFAVIMVVCKTAEIDSGELFAFDAERRSCIHDGKALCGGDFIA